jgi:outer membrane murein-binding lipoprotein Lpp
MDEASAEIQRLRARVEQLEREMRYIGRLDYPPTRMAARDRARAALTP